MLHTIHYCDYNNNCFVSENKYMKKRVCVKNYVLLK